MTYYRNIPNHFSFSDIYDEVVQRATKAAVFVEVGSWFGASAAYMGMKIRDSGKSIRFYAIDNFTAEGSGPLLLSEAAKVGGSFYEIFCQNIKRCGVADFVHPIVGDSTMSANLFDDNSLDFVYIDACHRYKKVKKDVLAWLPKIRDGGIIGGHDYNATHPGVKRAVDEIFNRYPLRVQISSWIVELSESGTDILAHMRSVSND